MRRTIGLGGYAAVAFVSYVSFGVLTCSCSSFPVSLTLFLCLYFSFSLSFFLALSRPRLFGRLLALSLFPFFLLSCCLYLSLSLSLTLFFFDALCYPISLFSARSFFHYYISLLVQDTHVTSNNRFLVCYTHYRDENSAFGSFKLDGLSDFTYTRLYRRSASGPVCTLLSLVLSSA